LGQGSKRMKFLKFLLFKYTFLLSSVIPSLQYLLSLFQ
jgi:hypothetical protein